MNAGPSELGLNHGAGKGDADRSPRWRDNYDSIDWRRPAVSLADQGFRRLSGHRIRKVYPR